MATVDVVIPSYGGLKDAARAALGDMVQFAQCRCRNTRTGALQHPPWECTRGNHHVRLVPTAMGKSVVHVARNHAVSMAMYGPMAVERQADFFFLMDDDMVGRPEYLHRLLSHDKDIVSGISTLKKFPPIPNIRFWMKDEERFRDPLIWDWKADSMEIDAVGGAFLLVKREVLEAMGEAWLACFFERREDERKVLDDGLRFQLKAYWDRKSELRKKNFLDGSANDQIERMDCWWFQFLDNIVDSQVGEVSEDISFCWKAKQLGYKIYADPQVTPGHLGTYAYSITDYREKIEKDLATGKLKLDDVKANELGF